MKQEALMEKIKYSVQKKVDLVDKSPVRYLSRAILAAVFLTLATVTAFLVAEHIEKFLLVILPETADVASAAYNFTKIFYALSFGWALVMILFMNSELFTSNVMYFSSQLFTKNVTLNKTLKVLIFCYIGNFIGAILMSLLFVYSGTFTDATAHFAEHAVLAKLAKDPLTVLLQGIIANLVVNIAIMLSMNLKGDFAKMVAIVLTVFAFAYFGSEHVIANFSSFALVGFATGFEGMSVMAILSNFFFSTIGNIIGGGLCIGVVYAWLNKGDFKYKDN